MLIWVLFNMWISLYHVTNNIFSYYCYAIILLYFLLITIYINIATVWKKSCLLCRFRNFYYIRYITTLTRSWFSLCLFVLIFVISRWKCGRSLNDFALLTMSCDRSLQLHTVFSKLIYNLLGESAEIPLPLKLPRSRATICSHCL